MIEFANSITPLLLSSSDERGSNLQDIDPSHKVEILLRCSDQDNGMQFGYHPQFYDNKQYDTFPQIVPGDGLVWLNRARSIIAGTGLPNYKIAKVLLNTPLKMENWRKYLKNYHDYRICDYLQFGFPLSITGVIGRSHVKNHSSAKKWGEPVEKYFATEINSRAMLGPFTHKPLRELHISPLLTKNS